MNLEKQAQVIDKIRDTMASHMGERMKVRANMGRSKIVENEGTLMQVHPQLFVMEVNRKRGRTARQSFQYVDILTGTVEISQDGEPLFERFNFDDDSEAEAEFDDLPLDDADDDLLEL